MQLIESPINYMGSKYKLLDRLIPLFPKAKTFVDLFTGGGSVYMNISHLYENVIANEYINGVYQIHKNLNDKSFVQEAINHSVITKDSQENYLKLREVYNIYNEPEKLLALIWSCNSNMMRFNNKFEFNQTWGQRCFNKNTQKKLDKFWEKDLSNVTFTNLSFEKVILNQDAFLYFDPPYSNTEAGYNAIWSNYHEEQLLRLLDFCIEIKQPFGISGCINNKPNKIYDFLRKQENLKVYYFEDLYQKISKKEKVNKEYYFTNS
jgi:DNA adenine methylase Dam